MKTLTSQIAALLIAASPVALAAPTSSNLIGAWRGGAVSMSSGGAAAVSGHATTEVTLVNPSMAPAKAVVMAYDASGSPTFCAEAVLSASGSQRLLVDAPGDGGALRVLSLDPSGALTSGPGLVAFQEDVVVVSSQQNASMGGTGSFDSTISVAGKVKGAVNGLFAGTLSGALSGVASYEGAAQQQGGLSGSAKLTGTLVAGLSLGLSGTLSGLYAGVHIQEVPGFWDAVWAGVGNVDALSPFAAFGETLVDSNSGGAALETFAKKGETLLEQPTCTDYQCSGTYEEGAIHGGLSLKGSGAVKGTIGGVMGMQGVSVASTGTEAGSIDFGPKLVAGGITTTEDTVSGTGVTVSGSVKGPISLTADLGANLSGTTSGDIHITGGVTFRDTALSASRTAMIALDAEPDAALLQAAALACGL